MWHPLPGGGGCWRVATQSLAHKSSDESCGRRGGPDLPFDISE